MTLGEKLKQARITAGLSQRQLCGERLTRNMLSQIENGSARPSMATLSYLAQRLEKPVSWFLDEETAVSPNLQALEQARTALALEDLDGLEQALALFREPDPVFLEEKRLLRFFWLLRSGERALQQERLPLARELLTEALEAEGLYITRLHRNRCRVLLALAGANVTAEADEEGLLARASRAEGLRRLEILGASENPEDPRWQLLAAEALFSLKRYEEAARCYQKSPQNRQVWARLEICCRELADYKGAYEYACKQREEGNGQL